MSRSTLRWWTFSLAAGMLLGAGALLGYVLAPVQERTVFLQCEGELLVHESESRRYELLLGW